VAPTTSPSWAPAFARIGACITDVGGVMSHAAIVCREYGMPAVVGTGHATKIIKTGMLHPRRRLDRRGDDRPLSGGDGQHLDSGGRQAAGGGAAIRRALRWCAGSRIAARTRWRWSAESARRWAN
jgi:hypothetical protein